jgi:sulfur carrier protein
VSVEIMLNGEERAIAPGTTVEVLVEQLAGGASGGRGIAVALDGVVVPQSAWASTNVSDGASVEIVVAVQGG